jgi:hypothetical protein
MRNIALVLALGFTMVCFAPGPLEASAGNSHAATMQRVKVKRNKVNGRKAPRRIKHTRSKVN